MKQSMLLVIGICILILMMGCYIGGPPSCLWSYFSDCPEDEALEVGKQLLLSDCQATANFEEYCEKECQYEWHISYGEADISLSEDRTCSATVTPREAGIIEVTAVITCTDDQEYEKQCRFTAISSE